MGYKAKIILDSVSPSGVRLTTMAVTYPRIVLAEMNTHRAFSRNTQSTRAVPLHVAIKRVEDDPFIPDDWPQDRPGMTAEASLEGMEETLARRSWRNACDHAIFEARRMEQLGVHKQIAARLLEPFAWVTQLITATEWDNFFRLRCHPDAQPEMRTIAELMKAVYAINNPQRLQYGDWHLPFTADTEESYGSEQKKISVARCARVSYLTHEGTRDIRKDLELHDRLASSGHWSPFEHIATPCIGVHNYYPSNFAGWNQLRKYFPQESGICTSAMK